jgi:hypothetical protein
MKLTRRGLIKGLLGLPVVALLGTKDAAPSKVNVFAVSNVRVHGVEWSTSADTYEFGPGTDNLWASIADFRRMSEYSGAWKSATSDATISVDRITLNVGYRRLEST